MSDWANIARSTIETVARSIPSDASFKDRKAAIDGAYPFGARQMWPYKAWLKARRVYLRQYDPKTPAPLFDTILGEKPA